MTPSLPAPDRNTLISTTTTLVLVAVLGVAALWQATAGFRAVSSEDVRRIEVSESPRTLPPTTLATAGGEHVALSQILASDGRVAIVTFIYTSCNSICTVLGDEFQQLQRAIKSRGLQDDIRLISISFDPADKPEHLRRYSSSLQADASLWQFAGIPDGAERRALLRSFGVVVVPAPLGQFQHNAAFHGVSSDGKLMRIIDYDAPDAALAAAMQLRSRPIAAAGKS